MSKSSNPLAGFRGIGFNRLNLINIHSKSFIYSDKSSRIQGARGDLNLDSSPRARSSCWETPSWDHPGRRPCRRSTRRGWCCRSGRLRFDIWIAFPRLRTPRRAGWFGCRMRCRKLSPVPWMPKDPAIGW